MLYNFLVFLFQCNITLGWQDLRVTNTLAYWAIRNLRRKQSVVNMTPGACIIKLITAVIYGFRSKLEHLSLANLSSLV
jgi:hypothetical protein